MIGLGVVMILTSPYILVPAFVRPNRKDNNGRELRGGGGGGRPILDHDPDNHLSGNGHSGEICWDFAFV